MTGLRVLWLARALPLPAISADVNLTRGMVCALAERGALVTLLGLRSAEQDPEAYAKVSERVTWKSVDATQRGRVRGLFSLMPLVAARHAVPAYLAALRAELATGDYDIVVLDHYAMGWVIGAAGRDFEAAGVRLVHVAHDFETEVMAAIASNFRGSFARRLALQLNAVKTKRIEHAIVAACDLIIAQTDHDARSFSGAGARATAVVRTGYGGDRVAGRTITSETPRRALILGTFQWTAKQLNLEEFIEAADARLHAAGIAVDVIGSVAEPMLARWEGRLRAIRLHGYVDDLGAMFDQARMGLIIEKTGGGFKHKTLDYVFRRLPVVGLRAGLTGIEPDLLAQMLVADRMDQLVDLIIEKMDSVAELNRLQEGAYAIAGERFDWSRIGEQLNAALEAVAHR